MISSWYKRDELGFRGALLSSASAMGSASSGLIGAGIQSGLDGVKGLESWRWMFIIEGSATVVIALCSMGILPNYPSNTKWLSASERSVAEHRLAKDAGGIDEDHAPSSVGFKLAFKDKRMYLFAAIFFSIQVTSGVSSFFPAVVETLGFSRVATLLLTAPPYIIGMFIAIGNNYSADKLANASFHTIWPQFFGILGFVLAVASTATGPRYFAMISMMVAHASHSVLHAWVQKTLIRPRVKRAASVAFVNSFSHIAEVSSSVHFGANEHPPLHSEH